MTGMLWGIDEVVLFVVAISAFYTVLELAFRLGRRHHDPTDDAAKSHASALQAALLGLLALLLGFNFAMAVSRFDARKTLIQDEVSAISSTLLRAQLLPPPQRKEVTELIRAYVAARVDFTRAGNDARLIDVAHTAAAGIERQLWAQATAMAAQNPSAIPTGLLLQSLTDVINVNERRRAALDNHVPETILYLLFGVSIGALAFIAYGYGLTGRRRHATTMIFAFLIAVVFTIILDLDQPRSGFIQVGEESMLRLQERLDRSAP
jgi:hypothetical protein